MWPTVPCPQAITQPIGFIIPQNLGLSHAFQSGAAAESPLLLAARESRESRKPASDEEEELDIAMEVKSETSKD